MFLSILMLRIMVHMPFLLCIIMHYYWCIATHKRCKMQNNCTFGVAGIVQSRYIQSNAADMENFGVTIRRLRVAQGWSQAELAEKIGTHRNTIVRMERSKDVPVSGKPSPSN